MNLAKDIAELHQERQKIEEAIQVLTRLAAGAGKRRGRPPKWLAGVKPARAPRKGMSAAARKAQSERMKRYWAAKRKAKAKA